MYVPISFKNVKNKYYKNLIESVKPEKIIIHDIIAPNILKNLNSTEYEVIIIQHSFRWAWGENVNDLL